MRAPGEGCDRHTRGVGYLNTPESRWFVVTAPAHTLKSSGELAGRGVSDRFPCGATGTSIGMTINSRLREPAAGPTWRWPRAGD